MKRAGMGLLCALAIPSAQAALAHPAEPPVLRVAYFVPKDREPLSNRIERLDRVMTEVQGFYRRGMEAAGHGPKTFGLDRDANGHLRLRVVRGAHPMRAYGREDSGKVREEVGAALAQEGLNIDNETVVIFELLLEWQGDRAIEVGPYCGGGDHRAGTAWVYDDDRLDSRLLGSKETGGYYGRPCSIGEFNSHYVGGVAHELGHALGLPHVAELQAERSRGHSLMGAGNHTYGEELRSEGPGTFFSPVSAMLLAKHRLFRGGAQAVASGPSCELQDLKAVWEQGQLRLSGRVSGKQPVYGIAAFNDWGGIPDDYDAKGWTSKVGPDGAFSFAIVELRPGPWQLRLVACHEDGHVRAFPFDYRVDDKGVPDTGIFGYALPLAEAFRAFAAGDRQRLEALTRRLETEFAAVEPVRRQAAVLRRLQEPTKLKSLSLQPPEAKKARLAELELEGESVGWRQPLRNHVPAEGEGGVLLQVDGKFYDSGFYAHAPARHLLVLGPGWKLLRSGYGLQDEHGGSVVFVVRGDGRELFRSPPVRDHELRRLEVDVSNVRRLELLVDDAGDGNSGDWGVWIEPELEK